MSKKHTSISGCRGTVFGEVDSGHFSLSDTRETTKEGRKLDETEEKINYMGDQSTCQGVRIEIPIMKKSLLKFLV